MRLAHLFRRGAILGALLEASASAQTPSTIVALKIDEVSQSSATTQQIGLADLAIDVLFAEAPPPATVVRLQGPVVSLTLLRQADGSYEGEQQFANHGALNSAYPDGAYILTVSGGTTPSTTALPLTFQGAVAPVLITNYAALQAWPDNNPMIAWQAIPGASADDLLQYDVSDAAGDDLETNSLSATQTGLFVGPLPVQTPLTFDLTFLRLGYQLVNAGTTDVAMGSGFDVEINLECLPTPPYFVAQPASLILQAGATGTMSASVANPPVGFSLPVSYQWSKNGVPIPGATTDSYAITNAQVSNLGSYTLQVTGEGGTAVSNPAILAVSDSLYLSLYAGRPDVPGSADGPAAAATFNGPSQIAIDAAGDIYVSDSGNFTIRKISRGGAVTTIAGLAGQSGAIDGQGSAARFVSPGPIALDPAGNVYVLDQGRAAALRKIDPTGNVTTVAGGTVGDSDGTGSAAQFTYAEGLAIDSTGNIYLADSFANKIRKVTAAGAVTTLAGGGGGIGYADGIGLAAHFYNPEGIGCDAAGNIYVGDANNGMIRKVTPAGVVTTVVGNYGEDSFVPIGGDGIASAAAVVRSPTSLAVDGAGNIYFADNGTVREATTQGTVVTLAAGSTGMGNQTYPAGNVALDANGTLYVASPADVVLKAQRVLGSPNPEITITQSPQSALIAPGGSVAFTVAATGPDLTYQWLLNGAPIAGATGPQLVLQGTSAGDAGNYAVEVGNGIGMVASAPAALAFGPAGTAGRIANLSIRGAAGSGAETLTVGFVVNGNAAAAEPLLVRGIGPALALYGISGVLNQPAITVFTSGQQAVSTNAGWGGTSVLATDFASVGAFALAPNSLDAALATNLGAGAYTVQVTGNNQSTGIALAELYELPGASSGGSRLTNVSARAQSGTGSNVLTAGFVVSGSTAITVLVRGIGPGLGPYGVTGILTNPTLTVFDASGNVAASNTGWGGNPILASVFASVSAFGLNVSSTDCALVTTLAPGSYTAQVSGLGGAAGVALVEVYVVP